MQPVDRFLTIFISFCIYFMSFLHISLRIVVSVTLVALQILLSSSGVCVRVNAVSAWANKDR